MKILDYLKQLKTKDSESKNIDLNTEINDSQSNRNKTPDFVSDQMVIQVMELLKEQTKQKSIHIEVKDGEVGLFESKFGGLPYLSKEGQVPMDDMGRQLHLLAQIKLDELPENDVFPSTGMLQFWTLADGLIGLDFDHQRANNRSRVLYYQEIDDTVTAAEVMGKYNPYMEDDYFPVEGCVKLDFKIVEEGMSIQDYRFDESYVAIWNELFPDQKIQHFGDLPDDQRDDVFNKYSGFGHKIGGYPAFTQGDVRNNKEEYKEGEVLLLQIDSIGSKEHDILWGDSGICNFFIAKEELEKKNYNHVLYNWDCY